MNILFCHRNLRSFSKICEYYKYGRECPLHATTRKYTFEKAKECYNMSKHIENIIESFNSAPTESFLTLDILNKPPETFIKTYSRKYSDSIKEGDLNTWNTLKKSEIEDILKDSLQGFEDYIKENSVCSQFLISFISKERDYQKSKLLEIMSSYLPNSLQNVINYISEIPGKLTRPELCFLIFLCMNNSSNEISIESLKSEIQLNSSQRILIKALEMIHIASLLHDDIVDESDIRRGKTSTHLKFGNKIAILTGDFLFSRACHSVAFLENINAMKHVSLIVEGLVRGELLQYNDLREFLDEIKENLDEMKNQNSTTTQIDIFNKYMKNYLSKIYYKTASLMSHGVSACVEVNGMQQSSNLIGNELFNIKKKTIFNIGLNFGIAFQLLDDLLDIINPEANKVLNKPIMKDIIQGVLTVPTLFAIQEAPGNMIPLLYNIVENKNFTPNSKSQLLDICTDTMAILKTRLCIALYLESYIKSFQQICNISSPVYPGFFRIAEKLLTRIPK
ncbi:hexaprenyl pyrophosphate synthetase, putative [Cryptosporidium muris RN66]|uniref:Hexaprenyl pyrophosphate synthetase, putative n=1 Tax=Cryptosporidium muris (strain RN66) TaxID=441375 RepID=B6AET7_CRYMR|nr:hexaprenyl pyrophosphate synthetase, putative [Cryptosporidium muris RN66]EEA06704.1 hexaprenyl pyrophosphate synthetase, putative [Cryptosporidium muris RN66]|eukprot:XP_002141053.1 hexaprenyl pyrophosphate synthetase [Cryptosporidium muris RN66]